MFRASIFSLVWTNNPFLHFRKRDRKKAEKAVEEEV
ncbi:hypothetical protein NT05LI_3619, partial [Listeria ivanovii FSL F6-596]